MFTDLDHEDPDNQRSNSRIFRQSEDAYDVYGESIPELELTWLDNYPETDDQLLYGETTRRDGFWDSKLKFYQFLCIWLRSSSVFYSTSRNKSLSSSLQNKSFFYKSFPNWTCFSGCILLCCVWVLSFLDPQPQEEQPWTTYSKAYHYAAGLQPGQPEPPGEKFWIFEFQIIVLIFASAFFDFLPRIMSHPM